MKEEFKKLDRNCCTKSNELLPKLGGFYSMHIVDEDELYMMTYNRIYKTDDSFNTFEFIMDFDVNSVVQGLSSYRGSNNVLIGVAIQGNGNVYKFDLTQKTVSKLLDIDDNYPVALTSSTGFMYLSSYDEVLSYSIGYPQGWEVLVENDDSADTAYDALEFVSSSNKITPNGEQALLIVDNLMKKFIT